MIAKLAQSRNIVRLFNIGLRLGTLGSKMLFTLYMGRYFSLADIGIYGLVFGVVMVIGGVIGMRIDYVVSREIVGVDPSTVLVKMRDQVVFYMINYGILAVLMLIANYIGVGIDPKIMLYIFIISVVEGLASLSYANMNSLEQPITANVMFFIRSGLWTFPIMILGFLYPSMRNFDAVFIGWIIGVSTSLIATIYVWRKMPWGAMFKTPVNWQWIGYSIKRCFLIWLGGLGIVAGYYVDRLVVAQYLGLEKVGIATFYLSFTNALLTIIQSGILSMTYPRLIKFYRDHNIPAFKQEIRQSLINANGFAIGIALIMGILVPSIGSLFNRPELVTEKLTLWLMLFGVCIRANTDAYYFVLFARHQDRPIWLGNLLFLIPALCGNLVLVPMLGLSGIGYSSIIAATFLVIWRSYYVLYPGNTILKPATLEESADIGNEELV